VEYEDIPEEDDTPVTEEKVTAAEPAPEAKAAEPEVEDETTVTSEPAEPSTTSAPVTAAPTGTDKMSRLKQVGVDTDTGLLYCQGDEEFYISMLESFVEESTDKKRDLDKFLKDEDLKNYAITVHSVKSTSKMIGIMELSDKAKALEEAAKNDDMDTVSNGMDDLMNEYDKVITNLENVLSDSSDKEVR
ncbi:MAG: Hpt domain-containing protein, partial [Lachnospiraceae bacterium]|nr:Hpt domain-containing protein [Lachnospiraceae bacterium]